MSYGGGNSTYCLYWEGSGSAGVECLDSGSGATATPTAAFTRILLVLYSGVSIPTAITFKPMICTAEDWALSHDYQPYALSNAKLTSENEINKSNIAYNTDNGVKNVLNFTLQHQSGTVTFDNIGNNTVKLTSSAATSAQVTCALYTGEMSADYYAIKVVADGISLADDNVFVNVVFDIEGGATNQNRNITNVNVFRNSKIIIKGVYVYVRQGKQPNGTIQVMICPANLYDVSSKIIPYAMSNAELTEQSSWHYTETNYAPNNANVYEYTGISFTVPANEVYEFYAADRNDSSVNDIFSAGIIVADNSSNVTLKASTIAENSGTPTQAPNFWLRTVSGITPKRNQNTTYYVWASRVSTSTSGRIILAYRKMVII